MVGCCEHCMNFRLRKFQGLCYLELVRRLIPKNCHRCIDSVSMWTYCCLPTLSSSLNFTLRLNCVTLNSIKHFRNKLRLPIEFSTEITLIYISIVSGDWDSDSLLPGWSVDRTPVGPTQRPLHGYLLCYSGQSVVKTSISHLVSGCDWLGSVLPPAHT